MASEASEQTLVNGERMNDQKYFYRDRAREFVELHDQVQTSVDLLDSLESFLSTFQKDLSAVSGQISDLQDRSKHIDGRLKSRRKIEKPLSNLISDITIPPSMTTLILDSDVGEPWITTISDFEHRLETSKVRTRVKAARDLGEVAEGLRIVAATKLRGFFLALFQPIRTSVTTNMQVIQTSVLLKYKSLFAFLQRQAPAVALELQRSYVGAARMYYETGFRRYVRSLGYIKGRLAEKSETLVTGFSGSTTEPSLDLERLSYAKIDGPNVTLAYMADAKTYKEPVEGLLRSLMLVLMDNASAEYTFVTTFFTPESPASVSSRESSASLFSPTALLSPDRGSIAEPRSNAGSDNGWDGGRQRADSTVGITGRGLQSAAAKAEQANTDAIWKQILDPVLDYCQTFLRSILDPVPPVVPLLTMIRLTEDVIEEVQKRSCPPLESFVFGLRLQMWPVFQKAMTEHVMSLKRLAEGASSGYFARAIITTDSSVSLICQRYIVLFNSFVTLTEQANETMIFSNLLRLRQELTKLISRHTEQTITDTVARATRQSALYEGLLQGLSKGIHISTHPKSQEEIAYWAEKEEEARRRIISASQGRSRAG